MVTFVRFDNSSRARIRLLVIAIIIIMIRIPRLIFIRVVRSIITNIVHTYHGLISIFVIVRIIRMLITGIAIICNRNMLAICLQFFYNS